MVINRISSRTKLEHRPRVSRLISEYVYNIIDNILLKPKSILQSTTQSYSLTLSFSNGYFCEENYPGIISKNDLEADFYQMPNSIIICPNDFTRIEGCKTAFINVISPLIDDKIDNHEYAKICLAMIHKFMYLRFKSIDKDSFTKLMANIDIDYLNSIPNPAKFKDHANILDESTIYDYYRIYKD
jgi:hypothetical protein